MSLINFQFINILPVAQGDLHSGRKETIVNYDEVMKNAQHAVLRPR